MICSYYTLEEIQSRVSHTKMQKLLDEVSKETNRKWFVKEYKIKHNTMFRPWVETIYELMCQTSYSSVECQVINFYRDKSDSTINTNNSSDLIISYLYGILTGINYNKLA